METGSNIGHPFEWALERLKLGMKLARGGWNGKGKWIECQTPDANSRMTLPYLYLHTNSGSLVPWVASHSDLLSRDWYLPVIR